MLHHSCFTEGPKLAVYEIWESQEAMDKFGEERLMPVMKELNFDAGELRRISGAKTQEIEARLGYKSFDEVIHRDNLVIL